MKHLLSTILLALAGLTAALTATLTAEPTAGSAEEPATEQTAAQERPPQERPTFRPATTPPDPRYRLPDSLAGRTSWRPAPTDEPEYETMTVREAVPMTSVVVIRRDRLPAQTTVLLNNTLRVGRRLVISNGQAENWGPYPAGQLDARTISMPDK